MCIFIHGVLSANKVPMTAACDSQGVVFALETQRIILDIHVYMFISRVDGCEGEHEHHDSYGVVFTKKRRKSITNAAHQHDTSIYRALSANEVPTTYLSLSLSLYLSIYLSISNQDVSIHLYTERSAQIKCR